MIANDRPKVCDLGHDCPACAGRRIFTRLLWLWGWGPDEAIPSRVDVWRCPVCDALLTTTDGGEPERFQE